MVKTAPNLDNFYTAVGALLNCGPHEVSFVSGASEAWWRAFLAVDLKPGDRVLVGSTEFQSAAIGLMQARKRGVIVDIIPNTRTGQVDVPALESMLDGSVKLVGLTQIAMSNGLVNPAAQVGAIVAQSDALYLLDACQAVGQMPVDVEDFKCDFLTATGRKWMRGPRGTGMLYVRDSIVGDLKDPVFVDGVLRCGTPRTPTDLWQGRPASSLVKPTTQGRLGSGLRSNTLSNSVSTRSRIVWVLSPSRCESNSRWCLA
jgi:cysteine desulfurase/selenocysteine lyase